MVMIQTECIVKNHILSSATPKSKVFPGYTDVDPGKASQEYLETKNTL